jgi:quercetin dioxygenase-like cupin family protein
LSENYYLLPDVEAEVEVPKDGILSRTVYSDAHVKVVVFGFDAGQELSEHTASLPAILNFVRGEADLTLGDDAVSASAGAVVYMPPNLQHSVRARTPVVMLLTLLRSS